MSKDGKITARATAALLLLSLSLGGCATSTAGSSLMDARAEAQAHPKGADVYLPVHDLPPKREKPAMTADEQLKLQKELIAVRDRQASAGKAKGSAARAQPTNP
jgi:hypothetical protein